MLIKLAATWEGIAAMKELEAEAVLFRVLFEANSHATRPIPCNFVRVMTFPAFSERPESKETA